MQMTIQLPEVSELGAKFDLLSKALRDQTQKDVFCEILNTEEACRYLKINRRYLCTLKENREIAYSQHGKIVRYRRVDPDRWMEEHRISPR